MFSLLHWFYVCYCVKPLRFEIFNDGFIVLCFSLYLLMSRNRRILVLKTHCKQAGKAKFALVIDRYCVSRLNLSKQDFNILYNIFLQTKKFFDKVISKNLRPYMFMNTLYVMHIYMQIIFIIMET